MSSNASVISETDIQLFRTLANSKKIDAKPNPNNNFIPSNIPPTTINGYEPSKKNISPIVEKDREKDRDKEREKEREKDRDKYNIKSKSENRNSDKKSSFSSRRKWWHRRGRI